MKKLLTLIFILPFLLIPFKASATACTPRTGYSFCRSIAFAHGKVPNTDQTNFPNLICANSTLGTGATCATVAGLNQSGGGAHVKNANGYDVVFASDAAGTTLLNWEVEKYVASTGELIAFVNKTVTTASDAEVFMSYGNSGISTFQGNVAGTWDSNFKSVLHMPDGSSLSVTDSTGHQSPTNSGATAASGFMDGGGSFVPPAFTPKYIDLGNITLAGTATYEVWVNFSGQGGNIYSQYNRMIESDYATAYYLGLDANGTSDVLFIVNGTFIASASNKADPGNWHHFVGTFDGSNGRLYRDGVLIAGPTSAVAPGSASKDTWIGANPVTPGDPTNWNGLMDEARISSTARSADWITTEYNNQSAPSTYETFGAETTPPVTTVPFISRLILSGIRMFINGARLLLLNN